MNTHAIDADLPILLADPLAAVRYTIRSLLRDRGFGSVREAASSEEIVRLLSRESFGLLISDWKILPSGSAEMIRTIRRSSGLPALPVIVMTEEEPVPTTSPAEPLVRRIAKLRGANCSMRLVEAIEILTGARRRGQALITTA